MIQNEMPVVLMEHFIILHTFSMSGGMALGDVTIFECVQRHSD